MKIIKRVDWTHTFTCSDCSSELEADEGDVKAGCSGYGQDDYYYVECPVCGNLPTFGTIDVPEYVQYAARQRRALGK
jgi:hypothetical protein